MRKKKVKPQAKTNKTESNGKVIGPSVPPPPSKPIIGPVKPTGNEKQPIQMKQTEDKDQTELKAKENGVSGKTEEEVDDDFIHR